MIAGYSRTHKDEIGDFRAEIKKMYESGMTVSQISRAKNRHHSTICVALKAAGVILPSRQVTSSRAYKEQPIKLSLTEHVGNDNRLYGQNYFKLSGGQRIKKATDWP